MNVRRTTSLALVATLAAGGVLLGAAGTASAKERSDRGAAPVPGMVRMHELHVAGPGMARMHQLRSEQNPGMARMHQLMTKGPR